MNYRLSADFLHKNLPSIPSKLMRIMIKMLKTWTTLSRLGLLPIITLAILTCHCKCQVWLTGPARKWGLPYMGEWCLVQELKQRRHLSPWLISHKVREIRCHWALDHQHISHRLRVLLLNLRYILQRPPSIHCRRWGMLKQTMSQVASLILNKM